jgi:uncharacterized protein (TIGR00251 family)
MDVAALKITERGDGVRFSVRVQPRASRAGVDSVIGDALKVRVHAPPVDGAANEAANEAVIEALAEALDVSKRAITIVSGESSRSKVVEVAGLSAAEFRVRLSLLA